MTQISDTLWLWFTRNNVFISKDERHLYFHLWNPTPKVSEICLTKVWINLFLRGYAFCMVFMWDGFFSPRDSESRPSRIATRVGFGDEWWEIHLTRKTIQNAFSHIIYTLRLFNQAKYTAQSCRSWKPCEMDLSHNCSLHGGMSEVCEKDYCAYCVSYMYQ